MIGDARPAHYCFYSPPLAWLPWPFITTEGQANGLSIMLGMAMALLGGCWYPIELFPPQVQTAVHVLPTTWAMRGFLDLIVRGGSLLEILPEAGVLLAFALVFFAIGVRRFSYE